MRLSRILIGCMTLGLCMAAMPQVSEAAAPAMTYRFRHHIFTIPMKETSTWETNGEIWTYRGQPIQPPAELRAEGEADVQLPEGFARGKAPVWNEAAIQRSISTMIAPSVERATGSVKIGRNASGSIVFDGEGFPGQKIDYAEAAALTLQALENGVTDIVLPVIVTPPEVTVLDDELREMGIKEYVTIGESDFSGSTKARIHNVQTGLNRFQGHLIEKDKTFSFVETLGPVDGSTGYLKELTIIGDKTLPDYGGGLCQVSSTAYRGIWEYGFPIVQRKNHSFAVHYYAPQGTDATVYPPNVDIKFLNDSPGALLMQTVIDVPNTKAYFIYYGTKDDRQAEVVGPYSWNFIPAPPPRTEYTTEIPAGTRRKVGDPVRGMQTAWFRIVKKGGEEKVESVYSNYQARPLYWQIGVDSVPTGSGGLSNAPAGEAVISD